MEEIKLPENLVKLVERLKETGLFKLNPIGKMESYLIAFEEDAKLYLLDEEEVIDIIYTKKKIEVRTSYSNRLIDRKALEKINKAIEIMEELGLEIEGF